MKKIKNYMHLIILLLVAAINLQAQQVSNVRFEQEGKMIHIYYDLIGTAVGQEFDIEISYSTNGGVTWSNPLKYVTGAVEHGQKAGYNKEITWNVLEEVNELKGNIEFQIIAAVSKIEITIDSDPDDASLYINGVYTNRTPCKISLPPGSANIELRRYNYKTENRTIIVSTDKTYFNFNLTQVEQEKTVSVKTSRNRYRSESYSIGNCGILTYGWHAYEFGIEYLFEKENRSERGMLGGGTYYKFLFDKPYKDEIEYSRDIERDSSGHTKYFDFSKNAENYYINILGGIYLKYGYKIYNPITLVPNFNVGIQVFEQKRLYKADADYSYKCDESWHDLNAGESIIVKEDGGLTDNTLKKTSLTLGLGLGIPIAEVIYLSLDTYLISADGFGCKIGLGIRVY